MRKTLRTSLCIAMLGWAGTAAAASNFYEMQTGYVFDNLNTTKTWTFDLNNDSLLSDWDGSGSDPYGAPININHEDEITSAWIEIAFYDNDYIINETTGNERVAYREFASLTADGTLIFDGKEIDDGFFYTDIQVNLLYDHIIDINITNILKNNSNDFEVYGVLLGGSFIDTPPLNTNPVPLPSAMLLLGASLVGLAGVRRKKARRKRYNV